MLVWIVGKLGLQNQLLALFLREHAAAETRCVTALEEIPPAGSNAGQELILFDCYGFSQETLLGCLTPNALLSRDQHCCALFNLPRDCAIEPLALASGIRGFFYEGDCLELLAKGMQALAGGEFWVSRSKLAECLQGSHCYLASAVCPLPGFSRRESQILAILQRGCSNQEIADQLCISLSTAKTHLRHIFRKLAVTTRLQAMQRARQLADQRLGSGRPRSS